MGPERGSISGTTLLVILSHAAPLAPPGPCAQSLFATIQGHTFSLCLIISNWKKNCLANQLASPQLRCPSNPALRVTQERRRFATSALQGAPRKGGRHRYAPGLASPQRPARTRARPRTGSTGSTRARPQPFWKAEGVSEIDF